MNVWMLFHQDCLIKSIILFAFDFLINWEDLLKQMYGLLLKIVIFIEFIMAYTNTVGFRVSQNIYLNLTLLSKCLSSGNRENWIKILDILL